VQLALGGGLHLWQIYKERSPNSTRWSQESRPYFYLTGTLPLKVVSVGERARIEARHADNRDPEWVWLYRNRVRIDGILPGKAVWLAPYVGVEPFLQFDEGLIENRWYAGSKFKPLKWLDVDAGYFHQTKWAGDTKTKGHVFTLNIRLKPAPLLAPKAKNGEAK
jgi:hypothetical protein